MNEKPDCFECANKRNVPGDCHISCANSKAKVSAVTHGVRNGWFMWPFNFDPCWLVSCDSFKPKPTKAPN